MSGSRQSPQLLCAVVAALLHLATSANAQTSAVLQGTVIDPSGAVVSGVTVLAEHTATGTQRHSLTDASGRYQFVALMAGEYRIEVRAQAFGSQILERFVVDGGRTIVGSRNFGVIANTRFPTGELGSSRQIQCSARITF